MPVPKRYRGKSGRRELITRNYGTEVWHPFSCSFQSGTRSVAVSSLAPVQLRFPVWHLFTCTYPYRGLTVVTLSWPAGALGFTLTLLAGIPTYTWYGRTSLVATAI